MYQHMQYVHGFCTCGTSENNSLFGADLVGMYDHTENYFHVTRRNVTILYDIGAIGEQIAFCLLYSAT